MGPGLLLWASGFGLGKWVSWLEKVGGGGGEERSGDEEEEDKFVKHGVAGNLWYKGFGGLAWLLSEPLSASSGRSDCSGGRKGWLKEDGFSTFTTSNTQRPTTSHSPALCGHSLGDLQFNSVLTLPSQS